MSSPSPEPIPPELILRAYAAGLFPMAESAQDPGLFWVDPKERGIFPLDGLVISRSLRKAVRSDRFEIGVDRDFDAIIDACALSGPGRSQTWINGTIRGLYRTLFQRGFVHTIEARQDGRLVGGLYGLALGGAFFGESMFHRATDASKVCLIHLAAALIQNGFTLLDAQFVTPHLASLGAVEIPRSAYRERLADALALDAVFGPVRTGPASGAAALAMVDQARAHRLPDGFGPPNSEL